MTERIQSTILWLMFTIATAWAAFESDSTVVAAILLIFTVIALVVMTRKIRGNSV